MGCDDRKCAWLAVHIFGFYREEWEIFGENHKIWEFLMKIYIFIVNKLQTYQLSFSSEQFQKFSTLTNTKKIVSFGVFTLSNSKINKIEFTLNIYSFQWAQICQKMKTRDDKRRQAKKIHWRKSNLKEQFNHSRKRERSIEKAGRKKWGKINEQIFVMYLLNVIWKAIVNDLENFLLFYIYNKFFFRSR